MSYRKVQAALDTRLLAYQSSHVAFPGVSYRPAKGIGYLRVAFLPVPVTLIALGVASPQQHGGVYEITVTETSSAGLLTKVDELRNHFNRGLTLSFEEQEVHIDGTTVGEPAERLADLSRPLSVSWRSYF
jgi:hypothetical protein